MCLHIFQRRWWALLFSLENCFESLTQRGWYQSLYPKQESAKILTKSFVRTLCYVPTHFPKNDDELFSFLQSFLMQHSHFNSLLDFYCVKWILGHILLNTSSIIFLSKRYVHEEKNNCSFLKALYNLGFLQFINLRSDIVTGTFWTLIDFVPFICPTNRFETTERKRQIL